MDINILAPFKDCKNRIPDFGQWQPTPENEERIIWLTDPGQYYFVRTRIFWSAKRDSKPRYLGGGRVIGYSIIKRGTKRNHSGFYVRRYFYLQSMDLKPDCVYLRNHFHPAEGVDPRTVKPGTWGVHLQPHNWPVLSMGGGNNG